MGWLLFWGVVVVVLALLWFSPHLRRRRPGHTGPPGPIDPRTEHVLREGERARGQSGGSGGGFGGGA